jgi:hypothetical protein
VWERAAGKNISARGVQKEKRVVCAVEYGETAGR